MESPPSPASQGYETFEAMKNNLQLSITSPCKEKFESFTSTSLGGFCSSCQKEVIDFTHWDEQRIKAYFKNKSSDTCGRFQLHQLKTYHYEQSISLPGWMPRLVMGVLLLITTRTTIAQTNINSKSLTEQLNIQPSIMGDTVILNQSRIKISGQVKAREDNSTLPGVNVIRKGTSDGVVTDSEGHFEIEINRPAQNEMLVFSFIGFQTHEQKINAHQDISVINVSLTPDDMQLGEVVVVGGVVSTRWDTPRAWWWRFRALFNR